MSCDEGDEAYPKEIMSRHYEKLIAESKKTKPNANIINIYLNKEFPARRNWLQHLDGENRVEIFMEAYPCFSDHQEVNSY